VLLSLLHSRKRICKYRLRSAAKSQQFHQLIKELFSYYHHFQVYLGIYKSVVQFDTLLVILEKHVEKKSLSAWFWENQ